MKTAPNKSVYKVVTITYDDYSEFTNTFNQSWRNREAVKQMLTAPNHYYMTEILRRKVREITISRETKYTYIED